MALPRPSVAGRMTIETIESDRRVVDALAAREHVVELADGRNLGYAEYGPKDGRPVLFFHGFGTTRIICPPDAGPEELGLRLIAVDRPGIGLSTPLPGRRLLDWPRDVAELADRIGVGSLSVIGWSGGG